MAECNVSVNYLKIILTVSQRKINGTPDSELTNLTADYIIQLPLWVWRYRDETVYGL